MANFLKLATAVTVRFGPFLDKTDGVTEKTALTPTVTVSKNNATFAARSSGTALSHDANGWYNLPLDVTDTGTAGPLLCKAHDSTTYLPVWREFIVLSANAFDALVSDASNGIRANLIQLNSVSASASNLQYSASTMKRCTITNTGFTPTATQFETADVTVATTDHYVGRSILFLTGALANSGADSQACYITGYSLNTGRGRFTVTTLTTAPSNGDTFVIV